MLASERRAEPSLPPRSRDYAALGICGAPAWQTQGHGMDAEQNNNTPKLPEPLGSAEYRTRLTTKLNCLIAVLEVAITKITKSMDTPGANEERLTKIRGNLENTLSICHRAKQTLDKTQQNRQTLQRTRDMISFRGAMEACRKSPR